MIVNTVESNFRRIITCRDMLMHTLVLRRDFNVTIVRKVMEEKVPSKITFQVFMRERYINVIDVKNPLVVRLF